MKVLFLKTIVYYGPYGMNRKQITFKHEAQDLNVLPSSGVRLFLESNGEVRVENIEEVWWYYPNEVRCYLSWSTTSSFEEFCAWEAFYQMLGWEKV